MLQFLELIIFINSRNYIVVDAKKSNGHFVGAEFTIDDFNKIINSPIQQVDEQQTKNNQESNISQNNFDKDLIMFIEAKNSNLGKVSEILSVTGYPDSTYEVRFEDGTTHQITITQDEKNFIKNHPPVQQPVQEQRSIENTQAKPSNPKVSDSEVPQTNIPNQQTEEKNRLINNIIGAMLNAGEFHNSGLDMSQKMKDIEYAKKKLESKSM